MSLRSATARWFELLTSREELGAALDCLARTRSVELQAYSRAESRLPLGDLKRVLDEFESLARRFRPWWPAALPCTVNAEHALLDAPQAALGKLRTWATAAEPVVAELEALALERTEIDTLERLCNRGHRHCRVSIAWRPPDPCSRAASTCCRPTRRRCRCHRH